MNGAFAFEDVSFRYRRSGPDVLDSFTWGVLPGRTVLLGPNGAGKTTLLALGADALKPQRGAVRFGELVAGRSSDRHSYRKSVGWMPQQIRAVPGLTCREQVTYAGWLKGMSTKEAWAASRSALDGVGLLPLADTLTTRISGGELRRVGLAQSLVHRALVLLLDEPTVGLDPSQRANFREILGSLPDTSPVVVSTHQVDDLSDLFHNVVILHEGRIRYQGTVKAFLELAPQDAVRPGEAAYGRVVSAAS